MLRLTDHDVQSLGDMLASWGQPRSHAGRILRAFYRSGNGHSFCEALPLSLALKARLREEMGATPARSRTITRHVSRDGTTKLLLGFERGGAVETVMMPGFRDGVAAGCVSSQVGCAMGCDFCASTRGGLERNLDAGEIVEQFLALRDAAGAVGRTIRTVVFMGMGEPLANLDNVIPAIRRIADAAMGGVGWRQVTVSTVGLVPGIDRLADADLNVHLALSLHAPDDETRGRLVPPNRRWPVAEVMAAARRFADGTGRVPNIEYCLLAGVNDSDRHATILADLMSSCPASAPTSTSSPTTAPARASAGRSTRARAKRALTGSRDCSATGAL